jgi:hypothetical protein
MEIEIEIKLTVSFFYDLIIFKFRKKNSLSYRKYDTKEFKYIIITYLPYL